jgi:Endonuclease-reverse transcriptase
VEWKLPTVEAVAVAMGLTDFKANNDRVSHIRLMGKANAEPRLIVTMKNYNDKKLFLENGPNLRKSNLKNVYVARDLTPAQAKIAYEKRQSRIREQLTTAPKKCAPSTRNIVTNIKSYLINCRGSKTAEKLSELLITLKYRNIKLAFITETWYDENCSTAFIENCGYTVHRCDRTERGRGGSMIIVDKAYDCNFTSKFAIRGYCEIIVCDILFEHTKLRICNVYKTPESDESIVREMIDFLTIHTHNTNYIVVGDLNFPKINWKNSTHIGDAREQMFLNFVNDMNGNQLVTVPTGPKSKMIER